MIIKFLKVSFLITLLVFTGCSKQVIVEGEQKNNIETEIKELISKFKDQTNGKMDITYNILVNSFTNSTESTVESKESSPKNFNLDGKLKLQFKQIDDVTKNTNFNLNLLANFAGVDLNGLLEGEIRVLDNQMYLNLSKIPDVATDNMNSSMFSSFLGKWYVFPLENNPMLNNNNFLGNILNSQTFNAQTEQDLALNELYMNTVFYDSIKVVSDKGSTKIYEVNYDKAVVFNYLVEAAKIKKEPMSETEIADLKKVIDTLELKMLIKFVESNLTSVDLNFSVSIQDELKNVNELSGQVEMLFSNELEDALFEVPSEVNKLF